MAIQIVVSTCPLVDGDYKVIDNQLNRMALRGAWCLTGRMALRGAWCPTGRMTIFIRSRVCWKIFPMDRDYFEENSNEAECVGRAFRGIRMTLEKNANKAECVGREFRGIWMTGKRMPMKPGALVENFEGFR